MKKGKRILTSKAQMTERQYNFSISSVRKHNYKIKTYAIFMKRQTKNSIEHEIAKNYLYHHIIETSYNLTKINYPFIDGVSSS